MDKDKKEIKIPQDLDEVWYDDNGQAFTMRQFYEEVDRITRIPTALPKQVPPTEKKQGKKNG